MEKPAEQEILKEPREKRVSQKEGERAGRRTVILIFLITVVLSLFFWFKRAVPIILEQIVSPYEVVIEKGGEE